MALSIRGVLKEHLKHHPIADQLFMKLYNIGLYLIGGILREFLETCDFRNVRDIDLVISTKKVGQFHEICAKYHTKKNSFGGYKINCDDFTIDVWRIESTWAYKKNIIKCSEEDYLKNLPYTVFYNMDSLVYDIKNNTWYDYLYKKDIRQKSYLWSKLKSSWIVFTQKNLMDNYKIFYLSYLRCNLNDD